VSKILEGVGGEWRCGLRRQTIRRGLAKRQHDRPKLLRGARSCACVPSLFGLCDFAALDFPQMQLIVVCYVELMVAVV